VAAKKSTQRVTQVDPWIFGGDGRLVDLFPFPPWLILLGRFILACFRHPIRTAIFILTIYFMFPTPDNPNTPQDESTPINWWALLFIPLIYLIIASLHILKHWYYSPEVPLFRWKRR
jgi:hypothetical protein